MTAPRRLLVIPARGGSVRVPRKNVRAFFGKPVLAWTLETALESGCFSDVVVSTEDDDIRRIALEHGASVPFVRPAALADDTTGTRDVIRHATEMWARDHGPPSLVGCLYPTAALVHVSDLRRAVATIEGDASIARLTSVVPFEHPAQRALRIGPDGRLEMLDPATASMRTQDLEPTYRDAGQFYFWRTDVLLLRNRPPPPATPFVLARSHAQDIDTEEDWAVAEALFACFRERD